MDAVPQNHLCSLGFLSVDIRFMPLFLVEVSGEEGRAKHGIDDMCSERLCYSFGKAPERDPLQVWFSEFVDSVVEVEAIDVEARSWPLRY